MGYIVQNTPKTAGKTHKNNKIQIPKQSKIKEKRNKGKKELVIPKTRCLKRIDREMFTYIST